MPKPLIDLTDRDCRFVLEPGNQDRGAIYCAEPKKFNSSFCRHHHAICYRSGSSDRGRSPVSLPVDKIDAVPALPEHKVLDVVEGMK